MMESLGMSPGALPSGGVWISSWYVISIGTEHIAQSPQSGPRWSPAFMIEPVLFPPSQIYKVFTKTGRGPWLRGDSALGQLV